MKKILILLLSILAIYGTYLYARERPYKDKSTELGWYRVEDYAYTIVKIEGREYLLLNYGSGVAICER